MFKKRAAFIFKYQAVNSESESKVFVFSPFPKVPEVILTGAEHMLTTAIARTIALGNRYATRNGNDYALEKINETYDFLAQQLENRINMVIQEMSASVKDQKRLSEIKKVRFPTNTHNRRSFYQTNQTFYWCRCCYWRRCRIDPGWSHYGLCMYSVIYPQYL